MKIQISPRTVSLGVLLVVRRLLLIWYSLLHYWASKGVKQMGSCLPLELSSRREFLLKNMELQEGLRQIFAPYYHLCGPECSCCQPQQIPYNAVDGVLYGINLDLVHMKTSCTLTELLTPIFWENVLLVKRYCTGFSLGKPHYPGSEPSAAGTFCPALTETGCCLPWGRRPAFCVFFLCGWFIREMDWREYWCYIWISGRYFLHLTVSLIRVVAEWRYKQRAYALKTNEDRTAPW